jgi:hypothetical protein
MSHPFPTFGQCREKIGQAIFFWRKTGFAFTQQALDFRDGLIVFSLGGDSHITFGGDNHIT